MGTESIQRSFFQRLFGICATKEADPGSWEFTGGRLVIELSRAPSLVRPGGAVRIEKLRGLPSRVLVFRDGDGKLRAVENRCSHAGRRLDLDPESDVVQCCSIGKSRFDLEGRVVSGTAKKDVRHLSVEEHDGKVVVEV